MTESESEAQSLVWPWSDRMTGLLDGGKIELSSPTALALIAMSHSSLQSSVLLEGRHQGLSRACYPFSLAEAIPSPTVLQLLPGHLRP